MSSCLHSFVRACTVAYALSEGTINLISCRWFQITTALRVASLVVISLFQICYNCESISALRWGSVVLAHEYLSYKFIMSI